MASISSNLLIGIIGGVIASMIVVIIRSFWLRIFIPWFEERVYKDAKIEGTWHAIFTETEDLREEIVTLERIGHKISGSISCISGYDKGKNYNIKGTFKNLLLTLSYNSSDRVSLDRGSMTLMLVRNGDMLSGHSSFYEDISHSVCSAKILWHRDQNDINTIRSNCLENKHTKKARTDLKSVVLKSPLGIATVESSRAAETPLAEPSQEHLSTDPQKEKQNEKD